MKKEKLKRFVNLFLKINFRFLFLFYLYLNFYQIMRSKKLI
jgi:hypothetical protein